MKRSVLALAAWFVAVTAAAAAPQGFAVHETPQEVANVSFVTADGSSMTLDDFRGRVVLLNVWATWCVPCREEMPTLDALEAELGGPGRRCAPSACPRRC